MMSQIKRRSIAISITCIFSWICAYITIKVYAQYSFGLFIWLPIVIGALSTIIYAYKNPIHKLAIRNTAYYTLLIFCGGLLTFAFEGLICVIMAAPIGMFFTWVGYLLGYAIIKSKAINPSLTAVLLVLSVPVVTGFEYVSNDSKEEVRSVTTSIIIDADAEKVWTNVIAFPQLNEPTELLFKAGIAYPINAKIDGAGVGAIRHCNFSTGGFVEPITTWQRPNLLAFSVTEQPETMKELSFYNLHPNHLHGYFVSKHGQFKLTKLANGTTLLEGTTWYYNKIKPRFYWNLWSDFIVHKIHERVLRHIKTVAEKA